MHTPMNHSNLRLCQSEVVQSLRIRKVTVLDGGAGGRNFIMQGNIKIHHQGLPATLSITSRLKMGIKIAQPGCPAFSKMIQLQTMLKTIMATQTTNIPVPKPFKRSKAEFSSIVNVFD